MSERTDKLEAIFHAAAELTSAVQRASYLDAACHGDPTLRREVEALLKAIPVAEDMFQGCEEGRSNRSVTDAELIGSSVGRYKLLEKIGEGGMGVVYLAEQELPVRRKVALKIIKLGMDTRQVVARFEAERQVLALMDHPNIAQVLDGGATEAGRPYFVMELVQGVPITEFCTANRLTVEERLKLFMLVCQAIQSAHQKGIIHRDIKPTNVLVTMHNGAPHPMVIDFGVAKATGQKLTEKTLFTNFATMIGTPAYMSPEQAEMSKLDVDTRSDIYSLGVLLYELLTGSPPFPEERLRSVAYGEMQRIIIEEEPERPSTRRRKTALTKSEIPNPKSKIDSDLDWIVMKCLEKDRDRRYETANALAADLQAHLNDEPVVARPPSATYRLHKFVRRNRTRVAAGSFALVILFVAVLLSTWQAVRATRAERSSRAVKDFLVEQVLAANPYVDSQGDPNRRVQLERLGRALDGKFTHEPLTEAELRMVLGGAIGAAGDIPGALSHFQRAFEIRQRELGLWHSDTLWSLSWVSQAEGRVNGKTTVRDLLEQCSKRIRSSKHEWSSGEAEVVWTYADFVLWREEHRAADALVYLRESLQECRRMSDTNDYRFQNKLAEFARVVEDAGHFEEAEALWKENIAHAEQVFGAEHLLTIQFKKGYADFLANRGRSTEAAHILASVVPIYQRVLTTNHAHTLDAQELLQKVTVEADKRHPAPPISSERKTSIPATPQ